MTLQRTLWIALVALCGSSAVAADPNQSVIPEKSPLYRLLDLNVRLSKTKAQPGEVIQLILEGKPKPHCYTYPFNEKSTEQVGQVPSIKIDSKEFEPLFPVEEKGKKSWKYNEQLKQSNLILKEPFTWTLDVLVAPAAPPGPKTLSFTLKLQVCDADACYPDFIKIEEKLEIEGAALTPSAATLARPRTAPEAQSITPPSPDIDGATRTTGLWGFLAASAGAAILMLLTPCVFPMIPITVSFFLKQGEKEHHNPLVTALVYSFTIIVVLSLAVLLVGQLIVTLANNEWLNLGLGAVLIFFALSLFGMYEIELPTFLGNWTSSKQSKGGIVGTIFMSLTFTITSFTCTGPFLGPLLVSAKELKVTQTELILGAVTYSTVFAAPFFLLALFPSLIKRLPKSGGWLNSIKVVMGFLELAAALKFLANTDIALFPGSPKLFNYDTVLCAWMALSVLCGFYLLGLFRLPHDSPVESLSVPRMLLASLFFGLTVYMWPALDRQNPLGTVGSGITAFLPLDTRPAEEEFTYDLQEAWDRANRENKPIFIDFTGVNCTNCRANEKDVFPRPKIKSELKKFVVVRLYTDTVPDPDLTKQQATAQAEINQALQRNTYEDISNPYYVVIRPDKSKKEAVADGKIQGEVVMKAKGLITDPKDFLTRLKDAQKR